MFVSFTILSFLKVKNETPSVKAGYGPVTDRITFECATKKTSNIRACFYSC